ncbi:hypothetical protein [Thalassotalea ganghwensis]
MKKILLSLIMLTGCSSNGVDRELQNQMLHEFYANASSVKQVTLSSDVTTGMVGGAFAGAVDELDGDSEDIIAGGIAGALVGGFFTALFEGPRDAYEYQLSSVEEGEFAIIQRERIDISSGCVKVRVADKAVVLPAKKAMCATKQRSTYPVN